MNAKIPNKWLSAFTSDEGSPKAGVGLLTHPVTLRVPPLTEGNDFELCTQSEDVVLMPL